jgi:hypothetical protein
MLKENTPQCGGSVDTELNWKATTKGANKFVPFVVAFQLSCFPQSVILFVGFFRVFRVFSG